MIGQRLVACGLVSIWALATVGGRPAAAQFSIVDAKCRAALGTGVRKLTATVLTEKSKCHAQRMLGDPAYPSTLDCNDITRLPPRSQSKIAKAEVKFGDRVESKCFLAGASSPAALGFSVCLAPCNNISIISYTGPNSIAACLACEAEAEVGAEIQTAYGILPNPPVQGHRTPELLCQGAIGKAVTKYELARMREQDKCQYLKDKNKVAPPDCKVADLKGRIAKARTTENTLLGADCSDSLLSHLTSCGAAVMAEQQCIDASVASPAASGRAGSTGMGVKSTAVRRRASARVRRCGRHARRV